VAFAAKALGGLISGAQQAMDLALQDSGASVKDLAMQAGYTYQGISSTIRQLGDQLEGTLMQVGALLCCKRGRGTCCTHAASHACVWGSLSWAGPSQGRSCGLPLPQASPDLAALLEGRQGPLKQLRGLADTAEGSGIEWYFRRQVGGRAGRRAAPSASSL
jgi:hypothetical protein